MRGAIVLSTTAALAAADVTATRPNFLFMLADDWGWGDVGVYGANGPIQTTGTSVKTPFLDSFAGEGTQFTDFHTGQSFCAPSRTTFMFGRFPADLHANSNWNVGPKGAAANKAAGLPYQNPVPSKDPNVVSSLHDAGYATAHFGKWHLGGLSPVGQYTPKPSDYGFDMTAIYGGPTTANKSLIDDKNIEAGNLSSQWWSADVDQFSVDHAIDFMNKSVAASKPFFVNLWFHMSHDTIDPRPEWFEPTYPFKETCLFPAKALGSISCPSQIFWSAQHITDTRMSQVVGAVDAMGIKKNTMIVFSSDNGAQARGYTSNSFGQFDNAVGTQGPFRGCKASLYDGGHRVPFIVRWPGTVPAGRVDHSLISAVDWMPTILSFAGVAMPEERRGYDIGDILTGKQDNVVDRKKPLYWRGGGGPPPCWNQSPGLAFRDSELKLLINPDSTRLEVYNMSVYNLGSAFFEAQNIADQMSPDWIKERTDALMKWSDAVGQEHPNGNPSPTGCLRYHFPGLKKEVKAAAEPFPYGLDGDYIA